MNIITVEMTENNAFLVNVGTDSQMTIPDDMANRHRRKLQVWLDAGNTPDPYVGPSALDIWQSTMDSSDTVLPRWAEDIYDTLPQLNKDGAAAALSSKVAQKKLLRQSKPYKL